MHVQAFKFSKILESTKSGVFAWSLRSGVLWRKHSMVLVESPQIVGQPANTPFSASLKKNLLRVNWAY